MGGLINKVFGGGSNKAAKKSLAFAKEVDARNRATAEPWAQGGLQNYNFLNNILTGSAPEQEAAFDRWLDSSD